VIFDPIPAYRFLTDKPLGSYRYRAAHGGRGGAKSWGFADGAIRHTVVTPALRVTFLREVQATLKESSIELVRSRLKHYDLMDKKAFNYFRESEGSFLGRDEQKIMFTGLWKGNKPEGIKSLEGVGLTVLEEAQEVKQKSLDVLLPTVMRTPISELWALWNPWLETDPVDLFFRGSIKPKRAIVRRINYDKNPHFPEALEEQRALDFSKDRNRAAWIWNGAYSPGVANSIWTRDTLDEAYRRGRIVPWESWGRVVIGVDPSGGGDDVGIVAVAEYGEDGCVVLEDCTAPATNPLGWATAVAKCVRRWNADCVVAEKNFGGDMVESNLRAGGVDIRVVEGTATRGKHVRAEPVASLYDQGRVAHLEDFKALESELLMTTPKGYEGNFSPNRMDALVWAVTELNLSVAPQAAMLLKTRK
jgi:hypothetical protein